MSSLCHVDVACRCHVDSLASSVSVRASVCICFWASFLPRPGVLYIHAMPSSVTCISVSQNPFLILFLLGHWSLSSYPDSIQQNHVLTTFWVVIWLVPNQVLISGASDVAFPGKLLTSCLWELAVRSLGHPKTCLVHTCSNPLFFIFDYCYKEFEHSQSAILQIVSHGKVYRQLVEKLRQ